MRGGRVDLIFLNVGHFLDHLFMLVFATAAALHLADEWGMRYAALIPYATPGFVAFGVCTLPAGWIADKWSREGMMAAFFFGIGIGALAAGLARSPLEIAVGLTLVGAFAAIYHPVGLALLVEGRTRTGLVLAVNGVSGNMGVAAAALLTGFLIDSAGWRSAFIAPGAVSILIGGLYLAHLRRRAGAEPPRPAAAPAAPDTGTAAGAAVLPREVVARVLAVILVTTAIGGLVFQSTTFALPKVFDERLSDLSGTATLIGWYAFLVFSIAAMAQLAVGYLVDRVSLRAVFAVVAAAQAVFFLAMIRLEGWPALVVAVAFMLAVFGQIPINDVLVGRISASRWRSRAYGLRYVVTFSIMATSVPLIAWVHATRGFGALFGILAAAAFAILLAVLFLPRPGRLVGDAAGRPA